jgi:hypothetical protein
LLDGGWNDRHDQHSVALRLGSGEGLNRDPGGPKHGQAVRQRRRFLRVVEASENREFGSPPGLGVVDDSLDVIRLEQDGDGDDVRQHLGAYLAT